MVQEGKSFIKVLVNESQVQCTLSHRQLSQPLSVHLVLSSTPLNHCPLKKKKSWITTDANCVQWTWEKASCTLLLVCPSSSLHPLCCLTCLASPFESIMLIRDHIWCMQREVGHNTGDKEERAKGHQLWERAWSYLLVHKLGEHTGIRSFLKETFSHWKFWISVPL